MINHTVNQLDLTFHLSTYCGGGITAYHPRMLLKVLLYAYCLKLYIGRKIANALRSDITFMWLSGKQYPDFRTINNFRSGRLKDSIHTVFASLLLLLFNEGYIRLEEYYCDGTTIQADANKHKVVWKKKPSRYLEGVEARIDSTLLEIDKHCKTMTGSFKLYGLNKWDTKKSLPEAGYLILLSTIGRKAVGVISCCIYLVAFINKSDCHLPLVGRKDNIIIYG